MSSVLEGSVHGGGIRTGKVEQNLMTARKQSQREKEKRTSYLKGTLTVTFLQQFSHLLRMPSPMNLAVVNPGVKHSHKATPHL